MKRLIAISVVFALVAGAAFAADVSGQVIGTVNVVAGDSEKFVNAEGDPESKKPQPSATLKRVRLEASGENDDATFGGWIRVEGGGFGLKLDETGMAKAYDEALAAYLANPANTGKTEADFEKDYEPDVLGSISVSDTFAAHAWWKPIDQLKLWIGSNGGDGFFAKEGVTGWMFYQKVSDSGVVIAGNCWGGGYHPSGLIFRNVFYGGRLDGQNAFYATVSPTDSVNINIEIPVFADGYEDAVYAGDTWDESKAKYILRRLVLQADLNFDFGNIAVTYAGDENTQSAPGTVFAYFGLTSIENLAIDVGLSFPLPYSDDDLKIKQTHPLGAGVGAKFTSGDLGVKARLAASFLGGSKYDGEKVSKDPVNLLVDVMPFYAINDSVTGYLSLGLGIAGSTYTCTKPGEFEKDKDSSKVGWHINPYITVGQEWGPRFLAGIQLWSNSGKVLDSDGLPGGDKKGIVNWAIPIAFDVNF